MSKWRRQLKKRQRRSRERMAEAEGLIAAMERLSARMDEAIDDIRYNMARAELIRFERELRERMEDGR